MNLVKMVLASTLIAFAGAIVKAQESVIVSGSGASAVISPVSGAVAAGLDFNSMREAQVLEVLRQRQEQQIEALILERGAYGHGLAEAYESLGSLNFEYGAYQEAADSFRQAWHLSRIDTGLYSEAQIPYLNRLIEALGEVGRWDEAQRLHQLGFMIVSRVYSPGDSNYLAAAEYYTDWQWRAINEQSGQGRSKDIFKSAQELSAFYSEVIDKIGHSSAPSTTGLVRLLMGKARTDIIIAKALVNPGAVGSILGPDSYIIETKCFSESSAADAQVRYCRKVRLASFDIETGAMTSANYALGRYLKQIDDSLGKLERMSESGQDLNTAEIDWIAESVEQLREDLKAISRPGRRA